MNGAFIQIGSNRNIFSSMAITNVIGTRYAYNIPIDDDRLSKYITKNKIGGKIK
jgi:hypothetical protein